MPWMRRFLLLNALLASSACGTPSGSAAPTAPPPAAPEAAPAPAPLPPAEPEHPRLATWRFLRDKYDRNGDARITSDEYTRSAAGFERLDADEDGIVTALDFAEKWGGKPRLLGTNSEGRFEYGVGGPEVGDPAPEFELPTTEGGSLSLAELRAERPVVLVFGSFT
jgi:hypothetical protein